MLLKWYPIFDSSPLIQNSNFNNFLSVCWFLCKNLSNFVPPAWKLHNPYCHNSKALELHWKTSHLSWTPVLHCDFCDREFYAQGSLDNHTYKVHKIQTSFSCELCQFHCTRRSELETHIQVIFGIFEQKQIKATNKDVFKTCMGR